MFLSVSCPFFPAQLIHPGRGGQLRSVINVVNTSSMESERCRDKTSPVDANVICWHIELTKTPSSVSISERSSLNHLLKPSFPICLPLLTISPPLHASLYSFPTILSIFHFQSLKKFCKELLPCFQSTGFLCYSDYKVYNL